MERLHLILLYGFLCICAIGVVTISIVNVPKDSPEEIFNVTPAPPEPIVKIVTTLRELESVEICSRIDGCSVV